MIFGLILFLSSKLLYRKQTGEFSYTLVSCFVLFRFIVQGDVDGCVPFTSTQRWINCLNEDVVSDWRNWEVNSQNAGTIIEYDSISFVTGK